MPKIARDIEMETSVARIYNILTDGEQTVKWNPIINEIEILEGHKFLLKSTIGNIIINKIEKVKDVYIKWKMEQSDILSMGYILYEKLPITKVELWVEYEDKKFKKKFKETADLTLEGLKKYIDFIEAGSNIIEYDKR